MNRATADNQSEQAEDEGLEPTKEWVKDLVDEIIAEEFASPDLELAWLDEDEGDPKGLEAVLEGRVKLGAVTLNEMRDSLGLDPYANPAADRAMVLTPTGYVPIEANAGGVGANVAASPAVQKYSSDQPRVPAGNRDGGQWSNGGGSGSANGSTDGSASTGAWHPVQYAALDTSTRIDAAEAPAGVQYAGGIEDEDNENRAAGRQFEGTPAQLARQVVAEGQWRQVFSQVLRYDPTWKPSPALVDPNSIEGDIAKLQAWTKEAGEYLSRLKALAIPRDPNTDDLISSPPGKTGNVFIDYTTGRLLDILDAVIAKIGPRPDLDPAGYGMLVHTEFANQVRAAGLRGIDADDVERTFGVQQNASYGAKDSAKPDTVLRDDDGNIIAIYDVKTGAGFSRITIIKYRLRTDSDSYVPIFELRPDRMSIWKVTRC
jgi:hypothetical protein